MSENKYQALREQLTYAPKNGHARISDQDKTELEAYCKRYMAFLDAAKTEREAVREAVRQAEAAGFRPYAPGMEMIPGTKVYSVNHAKAINLAVIGKKSLARAPGSLPPISTIPAWISSPIPCMRIPSWLSLRPITMAASRSTSGPPFPWRSMAWW